jgi:hypothetical protein
MVLYSAAAAVIQGVLLELAARIEGSEIRAWLFQWGKVANVVMSSPDFAALNPG